MKTALIDGSRYGWRGALVLPDEYFDPATSGAYSLTADSGSFALTGTAASLNFGRVMPAASASFVLAGTSANLLYNRRLVADVGTYAYAGTAANVLFNRRLVADSGAYAVSSQTVNLYTARKITADSASYSLVGQTINLLYGRLVVAASASYNFTASDVALAVASSVNKLKLGLNSVGKLYLGSSLITEAYLGAIQVWGGSGAASYTLATASGTYNVTTPANSLRKASIVPPATGLVSMSGSPVVLKMSRKLAADLATFLLTGQTAGLVKTSVVTFSLTESSSNGSGTVTTTFMNDGTISGSSGQWLSTVPDTSSASLYEIRWTGVSGLGFSSSNTLTINTWYALSSSRTFSMDTVQGAGDRLGTMGIEIRKIGTTTPVYTGTWQHNTMGSA